VAWRIVHQQQDIAIFMLHVLVESSQKLLQNSIHHPCFLIGVVVAVKTRIKQLKAAWILDFSNDQWPKFITSVSIGAQHDRYSVFWLLNSFGLVSCNQRPVWHHTIEKSSFIKVVNILQRILLDPCHCLLSSTIDDIHITDFST